MPKMIVLRGLPASGKSTIAAEYQRQGYYRMNKDDLRELYPDQNERFIHGQQAGDIFVAIGFNMNMVIDNTNLNPRTVNEYKRIADKAGYEFEIVDVNTDWKECIIRDMKRKSQGLRYVERSVIYRMAVDSGRMDINPQEFAAYGITINIFDIDGTLANTAHRQHFLEGDRKNWKGFFGAMDQDPPFQDIIDIAQEQASLGHLNILVSGRPEKYRRVTELWLDKYKVPYTFLLMRGFNDSRQDNLVKHDIYRKYIEPFFNVKYVYDDRQQVVDMWRSIGLRCLQVAPGDF